MRYFLNVCYAMLLVVCSPWILYAALAHGKYREGFGAKLLGLVPKRPGSRPCVWLHGVSVGEINLVAHLVPELEQRWPDYELVVSTTTRTGYELAKSRFPNRIVFYCPLDFSWAVHTAMRRLRPTMLVLAELELWPNLVAAARQAEASVVLVNGRLSHSSWRGYQYVRPVVQRVLRSFDVLAVQTQEYAERFVQLGAPQSKVVVTGSIKFDISETSRENPRTIQLSELAGITAEDIVFMAGSTQSPEESLALTTFQTLSETDPRLKLVLIPRHPERFTEVANLLSKSGVRWQQRSCLPSESTELAARVLLVDTVGELSAWWGAAHVAFVGGSLGRRGGQNMIEPASYGVAVSFGPNTRNFRDVVTAMLDADAAVVVRDGSELTEFVRKCLRDPPYRQLLGQRARRLVLQHRGATKVTCDVIEQLAQQRESDRPANRVSASAHTRRRAS